VNDLLLPFDERASLEDRATKARARLVRTLDALDLRREQVTQASHTARRLAVPIAVALVALGVAGATAAFALRASVRRKETNALPRRVGAALEPTRKAMFGEHKPSITEETLRKVILAVAGLVATELAKRSLKLSFDGQSILENLRLPGLTRIARSTNATPRSNGKLAKTSGSAPNVVVVEPSTPRLAIASRASNPKPTRGDMR
jgi:hypothetical protein